MIDNNSSLTGLQQNQFRYSISQQCKKTCKQPKSKLMSNHDEMFYLNEEEFVFKNDDNDDEILNNKQSIDSTSLIKSKSKEKLKEISRSNYMHNEIDFTLNDQLQKQNKSKRKISIESVDELASNKTRLKSLKLDFYNKNHSSSSINDDLNSSISPQTFESSKSLSNFSPIPVNSNENKEDFDNYFKGKTDILKITCSFVDSNNNLQNSKNTEFNLDQTNNKRILTNSENYRVNTGMTTISDLLIIKANYNLLKFTGLKEDEITGKSFKILLKECDLEKYEELLKKILNKIMHADPALSYYMKPFRLLIVHNWKDENFEKRKLNASAINYEDMNIWPVISLGNNSDSNFLIELYLQRYEDSRLEIISDQKISKDCGIDRIMTLIDLHGTIISLDASNYREKSGSIKRPFPIVNIKKNHGLISDYLRLESSNQNENRYMLKLTDYVHNNDLVHIQKHVNDVLTKGEITSAIYRLKINEKYAFVQSQSKLIKNEKFEEQGSSEISNEFNQTYIHTIHSIIKEIDTEMEMKGNASTSLMKTLISKKSSSTNNLNLATDLANSLAEDSTKIQIKQSSTKDDFSGDISVDVFDPPQLQANIDSNFVNFNESVSPNSQLSAICKNLNIKSNVPPNSIANGESSLLTPIGTKFALTMLGLSKTQNKINLKKNSNSFENLNCSSSSNQNMVSLVSDNQLKEYSVNQSKVSKEIKRENDFFPSGNIKNDFDCMDIKTIKENKLKLNLIKKKSIEENAFNLKNSIDPDSSFKMLIKKELQSLEQRQINENNENDLDKANLIPIKSNRANSKNIQTFDCFENSGQHENFQASTNKKKSSASEYSTPKLKTISGSKNILLKQLLSEESMIPTELAYSELGSEINSKIKTEEEKSKVNKPSTSNNYSSFNSKEENEINLKSSNTDDILLRALLNTNDLEADTLKIESVFKLGKTSNQNSRNCKINRQTSENKNKIKIEIFENDRYMDNLNDDAFEKFEKFSNSLLSDSYSKTHGSIHFTSENEEILSKNIKSEVDDISLKKQIRNQPLNNLINSYERISVEKNALSLDQKEIPYEINVLNSFATFNSKPIEFNKSENEIFLRDEEQFSKQNVINVFTEKKTADDLNNTTPQPSVNKLSQSKMSNITYNQKEKVETNEEFLKRTVFDQDKQQNPNEELQKQKRIEAITKLLKSDLLDSFKDTTIFKTNSDSLNKIELDSKNENFSNLNFDKKQNLDLLSTNRLKISQGNDSNVPNLTINSKSINVSNYGHNTIEKNNISEAIKLSPNEFKQNLSKLESYSASSNFDSFYQPQNDLNQQRNSNLNQMVINSNLKNLSNNLNDNNSIDLRKKLQDHLNQKKTSFNPPLTNNNINNNNIYSMNNQQITSNSIFMKNQSLNIAVVSPVISNQNSQALYQNNLETKDPDQKINFLVSENNLSKDLDLNSEYINRGYPKNSVSNNTSSQNQSNFHFNYENQNRSIHSFKSETQNNFYLDKNANNFHKYPTVQNPIRKNENYFSNQNTISLQPSQQTLTTTTVTVTTKHYPTVGTVQPYSSPIINYNSLHNMNMNSPNVNYDKNLISNNVSNIQNNKSEIFASNNVKNDYITNNYNTSFVIPQNKIDQRDNFHVYYDQTKSIEGFGNFGNSPKEKRIINQKNLDEASIEINTNINLNLNIPNNENPDLRNNISEQAKLNTSILSPNYSNISLLKKLQPESANSSDKNIYLSGNSDYLFNNVKKIDQTDRQNLQSVDIVPNFNKTNISELNEKPISEYPLYPNIRNENPHSHFIINNKSNNSYVMENKSSSFPSRMNSCNFTSSFDNNSKNSSQLNQVNNYYSSNLNNQNDINKNNYLDQNFVSHELSQNKNLLGVSSGCFKAESSLNTTSISNDIHVRSITDENRLAEPFDGIKTSYNEQNQYPAETNNFDYFEEDILNENLEFLENLLID